MMSESTTTSASVFNAVKELGHFYVDFGRMLRTFEKQLKTETGYTPYPVRGKQCSWLLKSSYDTPDQWIMRDLHRVYLPHGDDSFSQTLMIMLCLFEGSVLEEAALMCCRFSFTEPMNSQKVFGDWITERWRDILDADSSWRTLEPGSASGPVVRLRHTEWENLAAADVFFLDVTQYKNRTEVLEKLVQPIKALLDGKVDLDLPHALTIPQELLDVWRSGGDED